MLGSAGAGSNCLGVWLSGSLARSLAGSTTSSPQAWGCQGLQEVRRAACSCEVEAGLLLSHTSPELFPGTAIGPAADLPGYRQAGLLDRETLRWAPGAARATLYRQTYLGLEVGHQFADKLTNSPGL